MFEPVHVADNAEAARIVLFWLFVYAAGPMFYYTVLAFKGGKDAR